jgi:hypothetical protein
MPAMVTKLTAPSPGLGLSGVSSNVVICGLFPNGSHPEHADELVKFKVKVKF